MNAMFDDFLDENGNIRLQRRLSRWSTTSSNTRATTRTSSRIGTSTTRVSATVKPSS